MKAHISNSSPQNAPVLLQLVLANVFNETVQELLHVRCVVQHSLVQFL